MLGHMSSFGRCWCPLCRDSRSEKKTARRRIKRRERSNKADAYEQLTRNERA